MLFQYANNINEAASSFQRLFYVVAVLNVSLLVMFILNIIMSYFCNPDSPYKILICVCFLIMILQKIILVLLNPSHFSNFTKGFFSYIFYYLCVTYGMKFYEMANIDRNYENARLDRFYYDKV
jgi:MFS-type transporter involved in bile tolerance (Atg22 family)